MVTTIDQQQTRVTGITDDAAAYWAALEQHELRIQQCDDCKAWQFYPRYLCSHCASTNVQFKQASGRGTLWSFSVVERSTAEFSARTPYVVALVRLDEGPVMMTNIVDCNPATLTMDMPLEVRFEDDRRGRTVPVFAPAAIPAGG